MPSHTGAPASGGGGSTTFSFVQKSQTTGSGICTFGTNITAGNVVVVGLSINGTASPVLSTLKDGNGVSLTLTPLSPEIDPTTSTGTYIGYTLSAGGGTPTVTAVMTTGAISDIWCSEFSWTGTTPTFDTDLGSYSATTTNPTVTLTLAGANELTYACNWISGSLSAASSPWTLGTASSDGNADEYDLSASTSIAAGWTPTLQGPGTTIGAAFK